MPRLTMKFISYEILGKEAPQVSYLSWGQVDIYLSSLLIYCCSVVWWTFTECVNSWHTIRLHWISASICISRKCPMLIARAAADSVKKKSANNVYLVVATLSNYITFFIAFNATGFLPLKKQHYSQHFSVNLSLVHSPIYLTNQAYRWIYCSGIW